MHKPVLLNEVIEGLDIQKGDIVVDGTLGAGGHSGAICALLGEDGVLVGIDQDSGAVKRAESKLEKCESNVILKNGNFRNLDKILDECGIRKVNKILLDIGFSSDQIEYSERGFSFKKDEPLLMTLNDDVEDGVLTAKEIVNTWDEENIADILFGYGGERFSRRIAKGIVEARGAGDIKTSLDLAKIISESVPVWYRRKNIHPATKTFQALRITVNDELGALKEGLEKGMGVLSTGGRFAVISFHSLEDRIVKKFFKKSEDEGLGKIVNKKPIVPSLDEMENNKKSRSAKLRIFEKI